MHHRFIGKLFGNARGNVSASLRIIKYGEYSKWEGSTQSRSEERWGHRYKHPRRSQVE
jgi:hypothetical protein